MEDGSTWSGARLLIKFLGDYMITSYCSGFMFKVIVARRLRDQESSRGFLFYWKLLVGLLARAIVRYDQYGFMLATP